MRDGKGSLAVRFSVLALLTVFLVGGASAEVTWTNSQAEGTIDRTDYRGVEIQANQDFTISALLKFDGQGSGESVIVNKSTNNILASSNADNPEFNLQLEKGQSYYLLHSHDSTPNGYDTTVSVPKTYNDFDLVNGAYGFERDGTDISTSSTVYSYYGINTNAPPNFNSSSVSPDPPLIGENVSYGAEVYDPDGSVDYTNLTLEYGGSTVLSDEQRTGTTPEWNDIYTPQDGNKWLNATLEVVDDKGAVTEKEINRYLSDEAPSVSLNSPTNSTIYSYNQTVEFSVSDSDSNPGEDWNCDIDKDGSLYEEVYLQEGTNSTYSGTVRSDLGSHNVNVSCTDGAGNTGSTDVDYTVKRIELNSVSSSNQVYETTNQSYSTSLTTGDMIEDIETTLKYDGNNVDSDKIDNPGLSTFTVTNYNELPLVNSNKTSKNWFTETTYNYSQFKGGYATQTISSNTQSQEVLWSYYLQDSYFSPDNKYIETEDFEHNAEIHTETKKADLTGTTTYKRDSQKDLMQEVSSDPTKLTLQGSLDTGIADSFNQSTFQAKSEVDVTFNGDTRTITTGNKDLEVYRIQLFDQANPGSLTTSETLVFDVDYEEDGYDAATRLTMDLSVWKNEDEKIRRFQFQEDPAETHNYHIYPSWAEYTIQTKPYPEQTQFDLLQYFNDDTGKARRSYFFPVPQQIDNQTTTVPLKTINMTEADAIDFEVTESGGQPAENTYCRVDRKFGGGDFETVFMIKTGGQGKSQSFAEVNEIYYSFTCYKNGEVIEKFPAQIMQNPMILNLGETETETSLDYRETFDASCTNNETSLTCEYQSQTESLDQAVLEVDRKEVVTDITVCNKTSDTATGSLTCNGLNTSKHNYQYNIYGEYNDGIKAFGDSGVTGDTGSQYGISGIFITLIIFVFVYAATAFNVPLGIALGTLSMLFSSLAGFLALTPAMRATLIGLAVVAGLVSRR